MVGGAVIRHVVRPLDPHFPARAADSHRESPFRVSWTDTLILMSRELEHLRAPQHKPWVLQLDVSDHQIRKDGGVFERATPRSPAVRVAFESRHGPLIYGTDQFWQWQANVRAIALSLEALRKVDRYGVAGHGEQYRGWTAIETRPAVMTRAQAAEFIAHWAGLTMHDRMVPNLMKPDLLATAYRMAAKRAHPDVTGDNGEIMARLNVARDLLLNGGGS